MQASEIPTKFPVAFAEDAGVGYTRQVPTTPSGQPGAAAMTTGFPSVNFIPEGAGGVPPFGEDVNGILNQITAWLQWLQAGGVPVAYDATFQAGLLPNPGYPKGAVVASATTFGLYWISTVDSNTTNPDTGGAGWATWLQSTPAAGVQLQYVSGTTLLLAPFNGGYLWINGVSYPIPSGLTLPNGGLAPSTRYYVYAYLSGTAMTLEASVTGYMLASNGMPQKTGDATRTLVGMAYTSGASAFQAGALTLSYFNRRSITVTTNGAGQTWTSGTLAEIPSYPRTSFLTWADEGVAAQCGGLRFNSSSGGLGSDLLEINVDGITGGTPGGGYVSGEAIQSGNFFTSFVGFLSEGIHYATLFGAATGGTIGTISGCTTQVMVRG